jgi:hypothetical protein
MHNWNSWDDSPLSIVTEQSQEKTVQQQIELYRQQAAKRNSESDDQPQPDFFEVGIILYSPQIEIFN